MQENNIQQQTGCHTIKSGGHYIHIKDDTFNIPTDIPGTVGRLTVMSLVVFCLYSGADAAEISSFRTTDIESHIELRYLFDERIDTNAGVETLNQQQTTYEEEFSVLTHNYVYHPSFLKLDLGAGYTFVQDSFETGAISNNNNDGLYSLHGRASFLEKKPYPVSFFYTRENPASFPGLTERVQQTNTTYGFNFSLLEPVIPLKMSMFASVNEREGSSPNQIVDDATDRFGIRASKAYSENYSHQLSFDHTEEDSRSGSLNLPIMPTSRTTDVFSYSSDWRFGQQKQLTYFDRATFTEEENTIIRDEVTFSPNLLWRHSDKLQSSYHYNYLDSSVNYIDTTIDTTNHNANAKVHYIYNEQTDFDAGALLEDNQTTGFGLRSYGINGNVNYKRPVANGTLTLSAGLGYRQNDRDATAGEANIIGEAITLSGLTPVALARDFIITSSIVVQNLARSQTYVENADYRVIVIGARTEIQRLSGSNIGDPEQVVVDYAYQTGGSVAFTDLEQNYYAGLAIYQYYNLYLRYRMFDKNITSGNPDLPLNSQRSLSVGGSADYPVNNWLEVGANAELVNHEEDISSYDSQRYSAFGQFVLPFSSNLRLSVSQVIVDNQSSTEDTDLTSFSMILRSRPRHYMTVTAEAHTEEDTGSTLIRKRDTFKLTAQWQVYRLIMNAQAVFRNEQTGLTDTERAHFLVTIRRDI
jgi:hypothetical protein